MLLCVGMRAAAKAGGRLAGWQCIAERHVPSQLLPTSAQVYGQEDVTVEVPPLFNMDLCLEQWGQLVYCVAGRPRYTEVPLVDHGADLPEIFRLIAIMRVLALSTATVERSFWLLNNVLQTKQRNRLSVPTCDKLLRIKVNSPEPFVHTPVPGATRGAPQWNPAAQQLVLAVIKKWRSQVPRKIDTSANGVRSAA